MLEIKDLSIKNGDKQIIKSLSLNINDGEVHAIMGPNGAGKSTLGKALMNSFEYQTSGKIIFDNEDITNLSTDKIALKKMFLLSQLPPAIEGVTNFDLLKNVAKKFDPDFSLMDFNLKLEKICSEINLPTSYIFREVNVGFSGGERKKNELLHMWILEPKFIILDEIDSGLDVDSLKTVINSIKKYIKEFNPSILIITHRFDILETIKPDKVHVLKNGELISSGTTELLEKIKTNGFNWTNEVTL